MTKKEMLQEMMNTSIIMEHEQELLIKKISEHYEGEDKKQIVHDLKRRLLDIESATIQFSYDMDRRENFVRVR